MNVTDELMNNILPNSLNINTNIVETRIDGDYIDILTQRVIPLNTLDLTGRLTEDEFRACNASAWILFQNGFTINMGLCIQFALVFLKLLNQLM